MKRRKILLSVLLICLPFHSAICSDKVAHKFNFGIGIDDQIFGGAYRDNTKGRFYAVNNVSNSYIMNVMNVDIKTTFSMMVRGSYDLQINTTKIFNPFVGIGVDLSFPISKLNKIFEYSTNIGNFLDVTLRIGNSFHCFDVFDINVYANGGFGTTVWYANGDSITTLDGREYLDSDLKIAYGYTFGGGVDFVFKEFYTVGLFYNFHKMIGGQSGLDSASKIFTDLLHETFVNKYTNHTVGVKIGIQITL